MKPNKELISALRNVAYRVRNNPQEWNWTLNEKCNCGLLAQELGVPVESIRRAGAGNWSLLEENYTCGTTNMNLNKIMNTLLENGLEEEDFSYIEFLALPRDGVEKLSDSFLELADRLETRLLNQKVVEVQPVKVKV